MDTNKKKTGLSGLKPDHGKGGGLNREDHHLLCQVGDGNVPHFGQGSASKDTLATEK